MKTYGGCVADNPKVLVCGAGPVGLTLANELVRRGIAVRIGENAPEDLVVELEAEAGLTLRVLGPLGSPVSGRVTIMILDAEGSLATSRSYFADDAGRIAARDLPAGRHALLVMTSADTLAELEAEVPGAERTVQLQRGGFLEVTAPELADHPGRYPIEITRASGVLRRWALNVPVLRSGFARIGPLPAGAWTAEVDRDGTKLVGTAVVEPGRTASVEMR